MSYGQASECFNCVHHEGEAVCDQVCRKVTRIFMWLPRKWTKHKPLQTTVVSNLRFNKNFQPSPLSQPFISVNQRLFCHFLLWSSLSKQLVVLIQLLYSSVSRENHYISAILYARITRNLLRGTWSYINHFPESTAEFSLQWISDPFEFWPPGVVCSRLPPGNCILALSPGHSPFLPYWNSAVSTRQPFLAEATCI